MRYDASFHHGLFIHNGDSIGLPDIRVVNFDGAQDFGLLVVEVFPHNVPYSYFVWNKEKEAFDYMFTAFGAGALKVDNERRCLIETSISGALKYTAYYRFESDGSVSKEVETSRIAN